MSVSICDSYNFMLSVGGFFYFINMYKMNKDLPYEQQVKVLLRYYDQLVEENKALKARIEEMTRYGDPAELKKKLDSLPSNVKQLRELYRE